MESINLKYIIFAIVMLVFYIIRKGLSAKVKEAQKSQEQQALNKKIHEIPEVKEYADEPADLDDREMAEEEMEESEFDYDSEEYDEPEEQIWKVEVNEEKTLDEIINTFAYKQKNKDKEEAVEESEERERREKKEEVKPTYESRDIIVDSYYKKADFSNPTVEDLRNAIIWSEILAPPVSERDE